MPGYGRVHILMPDFYLLLSFIPSFFGIFSVLSGEMRVDRTEFDTQTAQAVYGINSFYHVKDIHKSPRYEPVTLIYKTAVSRMVLTGFRSIDTAVRVPQVAGTGIIL